MHLIKLNAIDSTNSYLRQLCASESVKDLTVVMANYQTNGRGQMGTVWDSQDSKNLIMSVFKDVSFLRIQHTFYISMVISLSILKTLEQLQIKKLKIKWPNDILSDNKKLAGILIENVIKRNRLQGTIIGVGININQTQFENLPQASSLRLLTGSVHDREEILNLFIQQLTLHFKYLQEKQYHLIKQNYEKRLFRKDKPSTFKDEYGDLFSGFIKGVTESGNLKVKLEDDIIKEYELKQLSLMY